MGSDPGSSTGKPSCGRVSRAGTCNCRSVWPCPHPSLARSRKVLENNEDALHAALHLPRRSVGLELVLVVPDQPLILVFLTEHAVADGEQLDVCSHEAAECVLRRAYNRL